MERISELTEKLGVWGSLALGVGLAMMLSVLAYIYLIAPQQETVQINRVEAEKQEKKAAQLKVLAQDKELVEKNGAEIYANYLKGLRLLPNAEQISQVLEAVERKAEDKGIQVLSFDAFNLGKQSAAAPVAAVSPASNSAAAVSLPSGEAASPLPAENAQTAVFERIVEGELQGNHQSLVSFLQAISYYERITEVRAISAVKNEKTGREHLKFVIAAYYLPKQIEVPEKIRQKALEILKKENFDVSAETLGDAAVIETKIEAENR